MSTRVFIADDETIQRMNLRDMLTERGYLVVGEAGDGQSAVNQVRELRPDLVLMDIRMPGMDGLTAAQTICKEHVAPVVLLTAFSDQPLVEQAKEAGVTSYLVKPLQENEVIPALEVALARAKEMQTLEKQVYDLSERFETRKVVDRAKGILMDKFGITENEAYRRIQKISMNARKSMREIAEAIILAKDLETDQDA
jgi:AmiR/NasT family two-component response regulator